MKSRTYIPHGVTLLVVLLLLLVVASWVTSIYGLPVRNLLSAEGMRWMLSHIDSNLWQVPLGRLLVLAMGLGIFQSSGLFRLATQYRTRRRIHSSLSLKQKRALLLASFSGLVYLLLLALATFSPMAFLMGVTGSLLRSPLVAYWVPLLSCFLGLVGLVYGIASGQFRNDRDVVEGFGQFASSLISYLFYLFLLSQGWGLFSYARLDACLNLSGPLLQLLQQLTYFAPLVLRFLWELLRAFFPSSNTVR
jgi:aminobenzoyl-glutamate transport protein